MGKMKELFMAEREAQAISDKYLDDAYHNEKWKNNQTTNKQKTENGNKTSEANKH